MKFLIFLIVSIFPLVINAQNISGEEILKKADEIRNPSQSFFMKVEVRSNNNENEVTIFDVFLKGKDKTLIKTIAPKRDIGRNLLMLEDNMWVYIPNLKREVRVSLNQKLTGETANGDIARLRWVGDYTPTIESEDKNYWNLFLNANRKGLTYDKLKIKVQKKDFHPIEGIYLSVSNKPLKLVKFEGYKEIAGNIRPTLITIKDALKENDFSTITITDMTIKDLPETLFNKNSMQ